MSSRTLVALVLLLALLLAAPAAARKPRVDLSPEAWPAGDLGYFTQLQNVNRREHPPVTGKKGIVVGTTGALAVRSGVEALRQGGTAADAAFTTALAQTTLMAGATVSFAGKFALVYYEASSGEVSYLNGAWQVPREETSGGTIPPCGIPSGRQVLVPGFMAALEEAHGRFGALPFESLFGPAIYFAREGFEVYPMLGGWIRYREPTLRRLPGGRQIFLKPDGTLYGTGDWLRQPRLAKTLKRVSRKGSRYMYTGAWARRLVRVVRAEGGRLSAADLAGYEPRWIEPRSFAWAGNRIWGPDHPGSGGPDLEAAFSRLSAPSLRAAGHYTVSVDALASLLEGVERRYRAPAASGGHSDGVVAIDADGNVAALLHTINTNVWGETGLFVDGVSIADVGCWAQYGIVGAGPGGRLASGENPLIVTRRGKPVAATSAVGSGLFEATFFSLANLLGYRMGAQQAIDTPTFHLCGLTPGRVVHRTVIGDFPSDLLRAVRARGYEIEELPADEIHKGWWIAATIDPKRGRRTGATTGAWNGHAGSE